MKAYECTRCDSFGTSGDPESQRCECDNVEDGLRAEVDDLRAKLADAERERDEARRAACVSEVSIASRIAAYVDDKLKWDRSSDKALYSIVDGIESGEWKSDAWKETR